MEKTNTTNLVKLRQPGTALTVSNNVTEDSNQFTKTTMTVKNKPVAIIR